MMSASDPVFATSLSCLDSQTTLVQGLKEQLEACLNEFGDLRKEAKDVQQEQTDLDAQLTSLSSTVLQLEGLVAIQALFDGIDEAIQEKQDFISAATLCKQAEALVKTHCKGRSSGLFQVIARGQRRRHQNVIGRLEDLLQGAFVFTKDSFKVTLEVYKTPARRYDQSVSLKHVLQAYEVRLWMFM